MYLATENTHDDHQTEATPDKSLMSQFTHDLSGSAITARGFAGEVDIAREQILELLKRLPANTDPDVMQALKYQLEEEIPHCLFRIDESMTNLHATIDKMKTV